ncbi:MAG: tetratricopeptide repeat protein [Planococcaceae bacterium]|nr:tetratricopeptide repeat protein [Planococcaceae bacterium]
MNELDLGILAIQNKDYEQAVVHFNNAIEEEPNNPLGYINFGNLLARMNEIERAERFFQKALTLDEQSATAYYGLANLYYEQERFEEAAKLYEKAIKFNIQGADACFMLGKCFERLGNPKLALPYLQRAAELEPEDIQIRLSYGIGLAALEMFKEAEPEFVYVIHEDINNADAHYNLGVLYAVSTDRTEDALYHLKQAYTLQPNFDQARYVYDMIALRN